MPETKLSRFATFLTVVSVLALFAGCGNERTGSGDAVFVDALGRSVAVPDSVNRIVSLAPSATETTFAAGAASKLVAVTTADTFPPEIDNLPKVSAFPAVDYERLLAAKPDLILASAEINGVEIADRMAEFNVPVFYLGANSLGDVFNNIRVVGTLSGTYETANAQASLLEQSVQQIGDMTDAAKSRETSVLILVGLDELYSFGKGSYIHEMVRRAGGVTITEDIPTAAPVLAEEFVLAQQPDVIIVALGDDYDVSNIIENRPTWSTIPAVQNNRVHSIDPDLLLRPGPRAVDGVLFLSTWITPEILTAPSENPSP